jgi:hypothetical protein
MEPNGLPETSDPRFGNASRLTIRRPPSSMATEVVPGKSRGRIAAAEGILAGSTRRMISVEPAAPSPGAAPEPEPEPEPDPEPGPPGMGMAPELDPDEEELELGTRGTEDESDPELDPEPPGGP